MAKKKTETKTQIIEDVPDGTVPDGTISGVNNGEFSFEETIEIVKVYKLFPGRPKPAYCLQDVCEITEDRLQNLYGGGSYTVEYFFTNGTKRVEHLEIADKPSGMEPNKPRSVEDVQIAMLKEQSQMNRDLLMAVLGRGQNQTPMAEIAQMWGMIHGSGPTGNGGGLDKMIDLFTKGMEIGASKGGDMDWRSMLVGTIKDIAPVVVSAIAPKNPNGTPMEPGQSMLTKEQMIKIGLQELKSRIIGGLPVGFAIEWMSVNANNPQYQPMITAAATKTFEELSAIDPEIANEPYAAWVKQLLAGVKQYIVQASQTDDGEPE